MSRPHLKGATVLVVEDEPLIAMDIALAFKGSGAHLTTTNSVKDALLLVEHGDLTAAILDHALRDGDSAGLCEHLKARRIPFLMYSGLPTFDGPCKEAPHLAKPASHEQLLDATEALIRDHKISD